MLTEFDCAHSPEIAYKKIVKRVNYSDFDILSTTKNEQIILKGNRDYSGGILAVLIIVGLLLFIIGLLIAAIYYWTRPYHKINIEIEPRDFGSHITITRNKHFNEVLLFELEKELVSKKDSSQ